MGRVPLNRALSKLRILSRAQATAAIRAGRVRIDGRVVRDPAMLVDVDRIDRAGRVGITVDDEPRERAAWRTVVFHKPRGVVTTRSDPDGRQTIYDVLGDDGRGLIAVGRLDLATSGLLLLTTDTGLAEWITDPAHAVPLRKASSRESHLTVELREGKNREVRRLFDAIGHEVTRLKRVRLGTIELGDLEAGAWRALTREDVRAAFPGAL